LTLKPLHLYSSSENAANCYVTMTNTIFGSTFSIDRSIKVARVAQLEAQIRDSIDLHQLAEGVRLPSVRALAKQCGVSTATVVDAYDRLLAAGYIDARLGSGHFVAHRGAPRVAASLGALAELPIDSVQAFMRAYDQAPFEIHAGCGWLPEHWLDEEGVKFGLRAVSHSAGAHLVRYGNPHGYLPLRQRIQIQLGARGIDASPEQIVLTAGASQALTLAMRLLLKPGDAVLCDDPCYSNLVSSLMQYGLQVLGVPRLPSGPDLDALDRLCAAHRPKAFFTNTTLHNPTGTSYTLACAHRVLQIMEQHDILIVEDEIFADLQDPPAPNLASLDQLRRVLHIQSFSKSISPSLRVGYIACSPALAEGLVRLKVLTGLTTSELSERMVLAIITEGRHRKHLVRLRKRLALAQETVGARLTASGLRLFHQPSAGIFIWARFVRDVDFDAVTRQAAEQGIVLGQGQLYSVNQAPTPWFRFNVARSDEDNLYRFLESVSG